jgi:hypothetical protein
VILAQHILLPTASGTNHFPLLKLSRAILIKTDSLPDEVAERQGREIEPVIRLDGKLLTAWTGIGHLPRQGRNQSMMNYSSIPLIFRVFSWIVLPCGQRHEDRLWS